MTTVAGGRPADSGNGQATHIGGAAADTTLRLYRNPLRLALSSSAWKAAGYLLNYMLISWVLFSIAVTAVTTAGALAITIAGIPLLIAAAGVLRGCANFERWRLRGIFAEPVAGEYTAVTRPGLIAQVSTRWRDRATWRDGAYLIALWVPLYILDTVVIAVWLTFLAGVTLPLWYWAPTGNAGLGYVSNQRVHGVVLGYFPHGANGPGGVGVYVDTLPKALLTAVGSAVLFLLFNYVVVMAARAHARVARAVLRPPADPLGPAKEVLGAPGPLGALTLPDRLTS